MRSANLRRGVGVTELAFVEKERGLCPNDFLKSIEGNSFGRTPTGKSMKRKIILSPPGCVLITQTPTADTRLVTDPKS